MMIGLLIFLGIVASIALVVVLIIIIRKSIKKKQTAYVKKNSSRLKELFEINSKYTFFNPPQKTLFYKFELNSKRAFDNFDYQSNLKSIFINNQLIIKTLIEKVTKDRIKIIQYKAEIDCIPATDFFKLPKAGYINKKSFLEIENRLFTRNSIKVKTEVELTIFWSYRSPAGRNYYDNNRTFGYDKIVEFYYKIFKEDLRNVEENERRAVVVQNVTSRLTDDIYKLDEIKEMIKETGFRGTKSLAESILNSSGFVNKKGADYYIRSTFKSINDVILASADDNGLITYNNKIKDSDYDKALLKLEKEGRIIPIDSLHFLKVCKYLNYQGVNLESIDEFDSQLQILSRKHLFLSIKQIVSKIDCPVTKTEFDDCFIQTLVKNCGFLYPVPGIDKLFTTTQKPQRIQFLEWLLNDKQSLNAFDLIYDLKQEYDIEYNIYSMTYDIENYRTKLYYNPDTEKIYANKSYFFDELEGVL